ncbi:MAG: maleylacetoacetate isomerase [Pseudomonadota bacterium]|nr:maleylacetoacetate isomerase [Pseudomonadota bacterium]
MILYGFSLSSASYRVRIALALKGLQAQSVSKHLRNGEHRQEEYLRINPQGLVPALGLDDGRALSQSIAIMEYLEELQPLPRLLPEEPLARARVRALSLAVACDIHPLNNLRVLQYLERDLNLDKQARDTWYRHWVRVGFEGLEQSLAVDRETGRFCHGDSPGMADACLVPQVYNARRFEVDMSPYPHIVRIDAACQTVAAFQSAAPERQA